MARQGRQAALAAAALASIVSAGGCVAPEGPPPVPIATELCATWDLFPHRIAHHELTFSQTSPRGGRLDARLDGGGFGALDVPRVRYGLELWRSRFLRAEEASVEIAIPPGSEDGGEPFAARREVSLEAGTLEGAEVVVALLRGIRVATDQYESPPPFETDPELPYDPAEGYTTQGLGVALGAARLRGSEVSVEVRVRNSLGLSDRGDMNAAIPQATTWVRVDLLLVGALGATAPPATGEASYFVSAADYGAETVHEHASEAVQTVAMEGEAGPARALFGLAAFDFWLNVEDRHDPSCVVVQDELNAWDEPISGPGRYVRELSARLWGASYDPESGRGEVRADLMLSNSSTYKEVGNLCLGVRAEVAMLQVDDADATVEVLEPAELRLASGEAESLEVEY